MSVPPAADPSADDAPPAPRRTGRGTGRPAVLVPVKHLLGGKSPGGTPPTALLDLVALFRCCLIDRTATLDLGFPYAVLDPLDPPPPAAAVPFAAVCDAVADDLVARAARENTAVRLLWSGGIDSTVAAVALLGALDRRNTAPDGPTPRLETVYSPESVEEYPRFFYETLQPRGRVEVFRGTLSAKLSAPGLLVTGEHGDQLFGSDRLEPFAADGAAFEPWADVFPFAVDRAFGELGVGGRVLDWLAPQLARCPRELRTLFDLFWWLNFSLKWQVVSLRIPASVGRPAVKRVRARTAHFFADRRFQSWAVHTAEPKHGGDWASYKLPAKNYLRDRTGDEEYFRRKVKVRSLRGRITGRPRRTGVLYADEV